MIPASKFTSWEQSRGICWKVLNSAYGSYEIRQNGRAGSYTVCNDRKMIQEWDGSASRGFGRLEGLWILRWPGWAAAHVKTSQRPQYQLTCTFHPGNGFCPERFSSSRMKVCCFFLKKKGSWIAPATLYTGGADETRTRDLRRDRPAF